MLTVLNSYCQVALKSVIEASHTYHPHLPRLTFDTLVLGLTQLTSKTQLGYERERQAG